MTARTERLSGRVLIGVIGCLVLVFAAAVCLPLGWLGSTIVQIWYSETKGPFYNSTSSIDLDGDGDLDIVVFTLREETEVTQWGGVALYFNEGEGQFRYVQPDLPPELFISGDSGDLDNDGENDILLLNPDGLMLLRNRGGERTDVTGEFWIVQKIKPDFATGTPGLIKLADLNGDGLLDAFVGGCCGMLLVPMEGRESYLPPVSWLWIQGDPNRPDVIQQLHSLHDVHIRDAAIGDLNGDGLADLWAAVQKPRHGSAGELLDRVLLNDGKGSLTDSRLRIHTGGSSAVALGDVDGDDDLDALVGTLTGGQLWINQGGAQGGQAGVFQRAEQSLAGGLVKYLFLEDLDGDGDLDLIVGEAELARPWWNDGQGGFKPGDQRLNFSERQALGVGDFNGDGALDIFAGGSENTYRLWWNDGQGGLKR